jgi:hypothetical protein
MRLVDVTHTAVWADALATGRIVGRSWPTTPRVVVRRLDQDDVDLARRLSDLTAATPGRARLRIPVPGDPAGLEPRTISALPNPWPPAVVLWQPIDVRDGAAAHAWVPQAGTRDLVVLDEVSTARASDIEDVATAGRNLSAVMREAAAALTALDVAQGRDGAQSRLDAALRSGDLPPGCDPRAVSLLDRALRLIEAVRIATEDEGRTLSSFEVKARRQHLSTVGAAARRALEAAAAACATPTDTVSRP